jgi:hypothetical protein
MAEPSKKRQRESKAGVVIRESRVEVRDHPLFDLNGERIVDCTEHATLEALYAACNSLASLVFEEFREGREVVDVSFYRETFTRMGTKLVRITIEIA